MEKRLLLIVNPYAGQRKAVRELGRVIEQFSAGGYVTTVMMTAYSGHAAEIARDHAHEFDLLACAGGDGTLNETISGALTAGAKTPLAYLPCGTTNDLGATLGLSRDLVKAAQDAVGSHSRMLDIGRFNGRCFVYTASFGAFTKASYATPQSMKNALGHLAYVLEGVKEVWHLKGIKARLRTDAGEFEGEYLFGSVTNSTSLAGIISLDRNTVKLDDGLFELMLVEKPANAVQYSSLLSQIALKRFDDRLKLYKVSTVEMETEEDLDWTLDGELEPGRTNFKIETLSNAIEIKVPET